MAHAANFNDDVYDALRDSGMEEQSAMRVSKAAAHADDVAAMKDDITEIKITVARIDERGKNDRFLTRFVLIPLLVLMQASLLGILTRGILWNIQP